MPRVLPAPEQKSTPPSESNVVAFPSRPGLTRDDLRRKVVQGRTYIWPPSSAKPTEYLSVTTALRAIPKEFLVAWAAKQVAETAVKKLDLLVRLAADDPAEAIKWLKGSPYANRDKAADDGSTLHEIAELDALGAGADADRRVADLDEPGQAKARQLRDFFARVPHRLIGVEQMVYSDQYLYAGTIDFAIEFTDPAITTMLPFPPGVILVDLKTGKGVYPEAALQLAAYRASETVANPETGERDPMYATVGAAVLHVTQSSWALCPVDAGEDSFAAFLACRHLSHHLPLSSDLVGSAAIRGKA